MIRNKYIAGFLIGMTMLLAACTAPVPIVGVPEADPVTVEPAVAVEQGAEGAAQQEIEATGALSTPEASDQPLPPGRGPRPGFGPGSNMMARHHAVLPSEYTGLTNPVTADAQSLARGQELYEVNCATCHGEDGWGNGPAGQALDPAPANIAHTSQMLSDAYLFWRISEGGLPFDTSMPAWRDALDDQARWDLVNYMRTLGSEDGRGRGLGRGPGAMGPNETEHRAEMLDEALARGVITQAEADLFETVHQVLDELYLDVGITMEDMGPRGMQTMQRAITAQAVRDGAITQEHGDSFTAIHDRLIEAGLMQ